MKVDTADVLDASILIVDDQDADVKLLEALLREAGYTNVTATMNSREVRSLHHEHRYDLILLDLKMPGMDGFEVMETLKAETQDSYLPVIVLTAQPSHKLRALQAGAKDFISKPFDLLEVKTRILNMLEVRLLYKKLAAYNELLEQTVRERTAELQQSEYRFRRLTELASDWYWEQNESGTFTHLSGPVLDTLGFGIGAFQSDSAGSEPVAPDDAEQAKIKAKIVAREPFLDFAFSRVDANGSSHHYRVSGEPMFDEYCRFTGYRGIGVEVSAGHLLPAHPAAIHA